MEKFEKIYIIGDLHGFLGSCHQASQTMNNGLIICVGDFGAGFIRESAIDKFDELLGERGNKLYSIRGNHDLPSYFDGSNDRENIKFLPDYTYKEINGQKFAFIGGAVSIDRYYRTAGVDWWEDEVVNLDGQLELSDVLISHTAPSFCDPIDTDANLWNAIARFSNSAPYHLKQDLFNDLRQERIKMDKIVKGINPKYLFYGHFHFAAYRYKEAYDIHCRLLNINEFVEFSQLP